MDDMGIGAHVGTHHERGDLEVDVVHKANASECRVSNRQNGQPGCDREPFQLSVVHVAVAKLPVCRVDWPTDWYEFEGRLIDRCASCCAMRYFSYRSNAQPSPINKSQDQPAMADATATRYVNLVTRD